ncbi:MAG: fructose-bisphosphate aldolase class I [Rhodospirillales bacterium]|nr:fructose-bisphosphate aldolase class I [Rhodospirillales bacterium]
MKDTDIAATAKALVADGRGILAADESTGTIGKRFETINVTSTADSRRAYRELLFTTAGVGEFVSGVILYDETLRQSAADGRTFVDVMKAQNIMPGIKVDTGAKPLAGSPDETVTEGLDGLAERFKEYAKLGARFAKWRAVIRIGSGLPTPYCIDVNAHALARYALLCQEAGLVPIVEPEVLMDGDHTIEACDRASTDTFHAVFQALHQQGVALEGMLLKPNMITSGKSAAKQASVDDVAAWTVRCLKRTVPPAVPGIVFLSGGQPGKLATQHLNAMNANHGPLPWKLSFSYGRALQDQALKRWKGAKENVAAAQAALKLRAKLNSAASLGRYRSDAEAA